MASKVYVFPGGKGANQAVGVGKLGGQVYMIGCLGNDIDGKRIYTNLIENHVHMEGVRFDRFCQVEKPISMWIKEEKVLLRFMPVRIQI